MATTSSSHISGAIRRDSQFRSSRLNQKQLANHNSNSNILVLGSQDNTSLGTGLPSNSDIIVLETPSEQHQQKALASIESMKKLAMHS